MWSLLLCGECYSWVVPEKGHCPDCRTPLRADIPDPSIDALRHLIGNLRHRIGRCRVARKRGEVCETLYLTTGGLFFFPHQDRHPGSQIERTSPLSVLRRVGEACFCMFRYHPPAQGLSVEMGTIAPPNFSLNVLLPEDNPSLPDLLMSNPDVFFIPRERILSIYRTRKKWMIERESGTNLIILNDPEDPEFSTRILELSNSFAWSSHFSNQTIRTS